MPYLRRALALLLCLCLLPACGQAVIEPTGHTASDSPVYRSRFTLSCALDASAFPEGSDRATLRAWQDYLGKISLRGTADTQDLWQQYDRVYFDGGLYMGDANALPFTYDGYYSYRYVRSPALDGASVFFQMYNFFEFMQKPHDYFGFPTQYMALLMYPEASWELGMAYYGPLCEALGGNDTRAVSYDDLMALALELDEIAAMDEDHFYRLDNYLRALLYDLDANDAAYESLCALEDWLDFLDPEGEGLTVTVTGANERWTIGGHDLMTKTADKSGTTLALNLPGADGRALSFAWSDMEADAGRNLTLALAVTEADEPLATVALELCGLPREGDTAAEGAATLRFGGSDLTQSEQNFTFRYRSDAAALPCALALDVSWLHPQTGLPAATLRYEAEVTEHDNTILVDRAVDDQNDLFHLNEDYIEEIKARFLPTLALAAVPFALEMPAPVLNDIMRFMIDNDLLLTLGVE